MPTDKEIAEAVAYMKAKKESTAVWRRRLVFVAVLGGAIIACLLLYAIIESDHQASIRASKANAEVADAVRDSLRGRR